MAIECRKPHKQFLEKGEPMPTSKKSESNRSSLIIIGVKFTESLIKLVLLVDVTFISDIFHHFPSELAFLDIFTPLTLDNRVGFTQAV